MRALLNLVTQFLRRGRTLRAVAMLHVLAVASLLSHEAHAYTCTAKSVAGFVVTVPANIVVPRDLPVGSVLPGATYTQTIAADGTVGVNCTVGSGETVPAIFTNDTGGGSSTGSNVTPIGNTGIGFKLSSLTTGSIYTTGTKNLTAASFAPGTSGCPNTADPCYLIMGPTIQMQFVKMQPIVNNPVIPGGSVYMDVTIGGYKASTVALSNPVQITSQTCSVTTPSIQVDLGSVPAKSIPNVGDGSTAVPFSIGVDCTGLSTALAITFTDVSNPGNTSNTLPLSADSTARGVGIQILKSGTPISYGPDASIAGNTNQITIGQVNGTSTTIPFTGRYVRTTSTITPGSANGTATFTMSYQ